MCLELLVKRKFLSVVGLCLLNCGFLFSQNSNELSSLDRVWSSIERELNKPKGDTCRQVITETVITSCQGQRSCAIKTFYEVMIKLERRFNLPAAIFVAEEIVKLAKLTNDLSTEAHAYQNLARYHGALGSLKACVQNLERALAIYEKTGDQSSILHTKVAIIEQSANYRQAEVVLKELEDILQQAIASHDTSIVNLLHLRLLLRTQDLQLYDKMEQHIIAVEKIPLSNPIKPNEFGQAIHAAMGRADLLFVRNDLVNAERFYQKTLRLCEQEPSRWLEIRVLQSLAGLERKRGQVELAKAYLLKAQGKAESLQLDELLADNYAKRAEIAEEEANYRDALSFTQLQYYHRNKFDGKRAGFNLETYSLQQENERLRLEKQGKDLQLKLRSSQLRTTLVVTLLVLLLAGGLFFGYRQQSRARRKLGLQNEIIQEQALQLKTLDKAKMQFFANVSHELRTPLTLVLGPVSTLMKTHSLSANQTSLLETAYRSGRQLANLVNEILDLAKLDAGKMELTKKNVELEPFVLGIAAQFVSHAEQNQIDFEVEMNLPKNYTVNFDAEKFRQIISNLLSNALKFTPDGGKINFHLTLEGQVGQGKSEPILLVLSVSNSGAGIHPDDLPHIFDRFAQSQHANQPSIEGTGIGLALCKEYATLFGGNIKAESQLGKGAVFTVKLPVDEIAEDLLQGTFKVVPAPILEFPEQELAIEMGTEGNPGAKVLIVEDNIDLQDYLHQILSPFFEVVVTHNGRQAFDYLSDTTVPAEVDLILSDVMMPEMDGYQLLKLLKADSKLKQVPVIMLTARAELDDRLKALQIGVDDYLNKPFEEQELLARIHNLLANYRSRKEAILEQGPEMSTMEAVATRPQWLEAFESYVRQHMDDESLSIPELARNFAMSESTLLRQLKRLTGLTPVQFVHELRLEHARSLLESNALDSIAKVAAAVGYSNVRSFIRIFTKRYGRSPASY